MLQNLLRRDPFPKLTREEVVRRSNLLVIDDKEFPYHSLFEEAGYHISKWPDVIDLAKLEDGSFDIILLDLHGVGTTLSADEGFGVLTHIRKTAPAQIVIAYSNAKWPLDKNRFYELADAVLSKTADYMEFKRTVDDLLLQRFSLGFYRGRIRDELRELPARDSSRLERNVLEAMSSGNLDRLRTQLQTKIASTVTIDRVIAITQAGLAAAQLWKS